MDDENVRLKRIFYNIPVQLFLSLGCYFYPHIFTRGVWLLIFLLAIGTQYDVYQLRKREYLHNLWIKRNKSQFFNLVTIWVFFIFILGICNLFIQIGNIYKVLLPLIGFFLLRIFYIKLSRYVFSLNKLKAEKKDQNVKRRFFRAFIPRLASERKAPKLELI